MNSGLFEHIEVFVAIARARSLTGASIATGIAQATISRQLTALEERLGCRLFLRSTRAISLTERGELFLRHALRLQEGVAEAEDALREGEGKPRGRIRVACSNGFAKKLLIPMLSEWQGRYPEVRIELLLSDQLSQLVEEGVDVAFRIGSLQESGLFARTVGSFERFVVAAPEYLKLHGRPDRPQQLSRHQCILLSSLERPDLWHFDGAEGGEAIQVAGRLGMSTLDAVYEAVLAGLGVAIVPAWFCVDELADGRVSRLLADFPLSPRTISAVTAARGAAGGKIALFVEFVEAALAARAGRQPPA
ncbi:MAG TPA: LysR family transcriptional regulator [Janthinobacterium sp.]|nr:LysR family transcriptional regulator [Janthinobacterium sp.]